MTLTNPPDTIVGYIKSWTALGEEVPQSKCFFWSDSYLEDTGKTALETFGEKGIPSMYDAEMHCTVKVQPVVIPASWELI